MGFSWEDLLNVINPPLGGNSTDADADADQERNIDQSDDSDNELKGTHHRISTNSSSNYNNSYSTNSRNSSSSSSSNCDSFHARFKSDCHWWSWSILCPSQLGTSLLILFFYTIKSFIQIS